MISGLLSQNMCAKISPKTDLEDDFSNFSGSWVVVLVAQGLPQGFWSKSKEGMSLLLRVVYCVVLCCFCCDNR